MSKILNIDYKYSPLFESDKRYYYVTGGRGSGKSYSVTAFLVNLTYTKGHKILFLRYTMTSAHLSIIPQFLSVIEDLGLDHDFEINKTEITNKYTGTTILFRGVKTSSGTQTANLKSITDVTTVVFDEFEEIPTKDIFKKIDYSVRKKGIQNRIIKIQNPSTKQFWGYEDFFITERSDTEYIHTTYLDNIDNLNKDIISEFQRLKETNPKEYENIVMGGWLDKAEGVIFENWDKGVFDESLPFMYGSDYGFSNDPSTIVKVAVDKKNMLLYVKEELYGKGLSTQQLSEAYKTICGKSMIVADSAEPRLINEVRRSGVNIYPVVKRPGSILSGIKKILGYNIIVCGDSPHITQELNNYCWVDKGTKTVPIDDWNHLFGDPVRYVLTRLDP